MRHVLMSSLVMAALAVSVTIGGCGGDDEKVASVCKGFCDTLVDAMDSSDWYNVHPKSATSACESECTDTINGIDDSNEKDDVEDCVECAEDRIDNDDDWLFGTMEVEVAASCDAVCYYDVDDMDVGDQHPWSRFWNDFLTDFDEHFSYDYTGGDSDSDADGDSDSDSDSDSDTDDYCTGYEGEDSCCMNSDPCGYADDEYCDCEGLCAWDYTDCYG